MPRPAPRRAAPPSRPQELLRFCSRRSNLVCRALPHIAESFREYYHKQLEGSIHQARCKLLLQRRLGPGQGGAGGHAADGGARAAGQGAPATHGAEEAGGSLPASPRAAALGDGAPPSAPPACGEGAPRRNTSQ